MAEKLLSLFTFDAYEKYTNILLYAISVATSISLFFACYHYEPKISLDRKNYTKPLLWAISLTTALTSYYTFKHTHLYRHNSLSNYDCNICIPFSIVNLHVTLASVSLSSPSGFLLDLRKYHLAAGGPSVQMEFTGALIYVMTQDLMDDVATVVTFAAFSLFLLCFLTVTVPGFGRYYSNVPLVIACGAAYKASRLLWAMLPYATAVYQFKETLRGDGFRHVGDRQF